jgi:hypothetical protein
MSALVDSKTVGLELGVPHTWVEAQARAGAIPHIRLGHYVRYDLAEVRRWVESLKEGGGPSYRRHQPGNVS